MAFGNSSELHSQAGNGNPDEGQEEVQDEVQDEVGELPFLSASRRFALATGHVVLAVDESASMKVQDYVFSNSELERSYLFSNFF